MSFASNKPAERFVDLFTPKFVTAWREGYTWQRLGKDIIAGLTVAIVALPLAMGIAIGSGVGPEKGLFTAIVAGFLISALGGSRFQIGGPTAAFIVVVYRTIEHQGYDGLALATLLAGMMLVAAGFLRLGTYIKYIPYPVTIGFTSGIGLTILVGQMADLLGLKTGKLPGDFVAKVVALFQALPSFSNTAAGLSLASLAVILLLQRIRPTYPRFLIAVVGAALTAAVFALPVATIGTKFGGIPHMLPVPHIPDFDLQKIGKVLPDAVTIAILAGIESLLSAVVADGMTGRRHRSNVELVAQGVANMVSPLFGGLPATGAIARTATNIRAGATGPLSGVLHALFLLLFMLLLAPLASYIPLCVLSAILMVVAWNMSEVDVVADFFTHATFGDRVVLASTFLLTVFVDLTAGIEVGVVLAAFKFMHNMASVVEIETHTSLLERDKADQPHPYIANSTDENVMIYHIHGPFFFGAASELTRVMQNIGKNPRLLVLDFEDVPLLDSTGASSLRGMVKGLNSRKVKVVFTAVRRKVLRSMVRYGLHRPEVDVSTAPSIDEAIARDALEVKHAPAKAETHLNTLEETTPIL